jgi:hypothetical protein
MFLDLPDPDPLVRGADPDPHQNAMDSHTLVINSEVQQIFEKLITGF